MQGAPGPDGGISTDAGSRETGTQGCDSDTFRLDHPWAQGNEAQTLYVRPGADGDGQTAQTPMGEFASIPPGETPLIVLFAAARPATWALRLEAVTRPLTLIGSCAGTVILEAQMRRSYSNKAANFNWRLTLTGTAGDQALVEISGTAAFGAQDLTLTSTGLSHGIRVTQGGDITLQRLRFETLAGHGLQGEQALGSWTVQDNTFLGFIGSDGISIVDFSGSGFRVTDGNEFHHIDGHGINLQEALGSWTVQDNTFLGPIGSDGISIVDFSGSGFRIAGNGFGDETPDQQIPSNGIQLSAISATDVLGSWTVQDNTFQGPVGLDGISIEGFQGDGTVPATP